MSTLTYTDPRGANHDLTPYDVALLLMSPPAALNYDWQRELVSDFPNLVSTGQFGDDGEQFARLVQAHIERMGGYSPFRHGNRYIFVGLPVIVVWMVLMVLPTAFVLGVPLALGIPMAVGFLAWELCLTHSLWPWMTSALVKLTGVGLALLGLWGLAALWAAAQP